MVGSGGGGWRPRGWSADYGSSLAKCCSAVSWRYLTGPGKAFFFFVFHAGLGGGWLDLPQVGRGVNQQVAIFDDSCEMFYF